MESRFRLLFLVTIVSFGLSGCAATKNLFGFGEEETPPPAEIPEGQVIEPEVERREIKEPDIDSEDFEVGAFVGIMMLEGVIGKATGWSYIGPILVLPIGLLFFVVNSAAVILIPLALWIAKSTHYSRWSVERATRSGSCLRRAPAPTPGAVAETSRD